MSDKEFPKGLFAKRNGKAPDFVLCSISVKKAEFVEYLRSLGGDEWANFQVKRSQGGKVYVELDTWKPEQAQQAGFDNPQRGNSGDGFADSEPPF